MKNNLELVEFAKNLEAQGARYWFGTFTQTASQTLFNAKARQYPAHYNKTSRKKQYEKDIAEHRIVCDCSGLIKGFMMRRPNGQLVYDSKLDLGANAYYNKATEKGNIKDIPEIPGLAVWKSGHIGVYIGNGEIIEARGFDYGVVKTTIADRSFTKWLKIPGLEYVSSPQPAPTPEPQHDIIYVVKKGDTLSKIAKAHGVKLKLLIAANPQIENPNLIHPGDEIHIP